MIRFGNIAQTTAPVRWLLSFRGLSVLQLTCRPLGTLPCTVEGGTLQHMLFLALREYYQSSKQFGS
ncbi:hypothetical protein DPMN_176477 [Dreissena polymorpha]|uniref:Uncharacterized protein n=1 Tax=Dreissena polymorpha TaxID=45954 RepID=A0A9D4E8C6_DREPO|nr:hypothetical protein DPMN_176477 [Dreissena polymorpha]